MPKTPSRTIRVDDGIWAHALEVAEVNHTTVTALVTDFVKTIKPDREVHPPKSKAIRPPSRTGKTTSRCIRIEDRVWNRAKTAAASKGTTVSTLIVEYLEGLRMWKDPKPGARQRTTPPKPRDGRSKSAPRPDPATCAHLKEPKIVVGRRYCVDCGVRLEEVKS